MAAWGETLFRILLASSLRSLFVACGLAMVMAAFRIRSSSVRHAVWAAALGAMLLMPVLPSLVPAIEIPKRIHAIPFQSDVLNETVRLELPAVGAKALPVNSNTIASSNEPSVWPEVLFALYATVLGLLCIRLVIGWIATHRLLRKSSRALANNAVILESPLVASPVTLGILRPNIILPYDWREWPRLKRRAILTHEIAHIRRRDPLIRLLAQLHCCIFWFNPLAWWMKRTLSIHAEHACDEAALRIIGEPRRYAEILLDVSNSVRGQGSRLSWQGLGVHGSGPMSGRIQRVLQFGRIPVVSLKRKVMLALTSSVFVILAVACRGQAISSIEEERDALKQFTAERVQQQDTIRQSQEASDIYADAFVLKPLDVTRMESRIEKSPNDNVLSRKLLVYYYSWQIPKSRSTAEMRNVVEARRRHVLWLIRNRPADMFYRSSAMFIPSDSSIAASDPEGHEEAKKLWLTQVERSDVNLQVLRNAAFFFESEEKPLAEQLLLRARTAVSNDQTAEDLASLYGLTLAGMSGFMDFPFEIADSSLPMKHLAPAEAMSTPFAREVQRKLGDSADDRLLTAVGMKLLLMSRRVSNAELGTIGISYLQRAVQINPASARAVQMLALIRSGTRHQRLYTLPAGDDRYPAVSALPKRERFDLLWELADDRFVYGRSFDVSQRDSAMREWDKSRRYAEDLVRLAPEFRSDPEYGAALLNGNLMLAFVAAEKGETQRALKYLREATDVPADQNLGIIAAPWQWLCQTLVERGEKEAVIDFLDRIAQRAPIEKTRMLAFAAQIRSGQNPNWQMYRQSL